MRPRYALILAEAISAIGSQVSLIAVPLVAVLLLNASPFEMGVIKFCDTIPVVLFGIAAGITIDKANKRNIMAFINFLNGLAILLIPFFLGIKILTIEILALIIFVSSGLSSIERIGLFSLVPELVDDIAIPTTNSQLELVVSLSWIIGPSLAGILMGVWGLSNAVLFDAATFLASAYIICKIKYKHKNDQHKPALSLKERLSIVNGVFKERSSIRTVVLVAVWINFVGSIFYSLQAIFVVRDLGITPKYFSFALAAGGIGSAVGSIFAPKIHKKLGIMSLLKLSVLLFSISILGISGLFGSLPFEEWSFGGLSALDGIGAALINVAFITHIQEQSPDDVLGQLMGSLETLMGGAMPVGALLGGVVASYLGVRETLFVVSLGFIVLIFPLYFQKNAVFDH